MEAGLVVLAVLFTMSLAIEGFPQVDPAAGLGARMATASAAVAAFVGSILAHELGHALVARRNGVGVLGITLSLLGGFAQLDRQAPTPRVEFRIAAAGPVVNLIIGAVLTGVTVVADRLTTTTPLVVGALAWLAGVNIVLAVLNLVPASPLDGGRVLTAALWRRLRDAELARIMSGRAGLVLGGALIAAGVTQIATRWEGLLVIVVGAFLFNGARGEIGSATIRRRLQRSTPAELMVPDPPPVSDSLTVEQLQTFAGPDRAGVAFPVLRWTPEPIGYVIPADGADLDAADRSWTGVAALMRPSHVVPRAWVNESIDDVLRRQNGSDPLLVVIHEPGDGRVVGTLSERQVGPLLELPDLWGRDRRSRPGNNPAG